MFEFEIMDMTCSHCVGAITRAIENVVPQAALTFDLPAHRLTIGNVTDIAPIETAIREAGYAPTAIS